MLLQAVFRSSPRVVLEEGQAALKLFLTVHVGAGLPAFQSFLSVNVVSVPCEGQCPLLRDPADRSRCKGLG